MNFNELISGYVMNPAIAILSCFIAAIFYRFASEAHKKDTIFVSCGAGILLSVLSFYLLPGFVTAVNPLEAAVSGIVAGLASTGGNQIFVKFFLKEEDHA